jgi:hypothetical protein
MAPTGIRNVGAIDPELRTSPVAEELTEDSDTLRLEAPEVDVCYFNGEVFRSGELVRSGTMILKCHDGLWIEAGPADPKNP